MTKKKKIITLGLFISVFLIINLFTNFNYLFRLFYNDGEVIYSKSELNNNNNVYEITNINKNVKVIELLFDEIPNSISVEFTNNDFSKYNRINKKYSRGSIKKSYLYVYTSLGSKVNSLKITSSSGSIKSIIINPRIPYKLNLNKTLLIFSLFLCFFYVFSNNNKLDLKNKIQKFKCIMVIIIIILILLNYYCSNKNKGAYSFYNTDYTNSLINRRLDLDVSIDKNLLNTKNPYDTSTRDYKYILDASYYKGKYYCYFGILPNLLLFVPYKLLVGKYMTNAFGCLIYCALSVISTFLLYSEVIKKYFKKITFRTFILSFIYVIFGSKLLWCMHRPNFYEFVAMAAYFHVTIGLYLVLFNNKENIIREFLGYTFLASAVLCRPTSLLASILVIPKLIDKFKKEKFEITAWIPVIIPYLVIGVNTMILNYLRFENVFEFGVSYQLAFCNLSGNGNVSILNGLIDGFYYLFATYNIKILPIKIFSNTNDFPILTDFLIEDIGGGVITTSFLGFIVFFIPTLLKFIKEKRLKMYLIMTSVLAFVLIFISSFSMASVGRYMLDFNYLIYFIILVISFTFIQKDRSKVLNSVYNFVIVLSIIVNFLLSLSNV